MPATFLYLKGPLIATFHFHADIIYYLKARLELCEECSKFFYIASIAKCWWFEEVTSGL